MRELKFRAYLEPRWEDDDDAGMYYDIQRSYDTLGGVKPYDIMTSFNSWLEEEHATVEQYTGLKDKNSKEIYEGDILKFRGRAYEVKFDNYGQFYIENKKYHWLENGYSFRSVDIWCADGILVEVIGNIHENPDFLNGKEEE